MLPPFTVIMMQDASKFSSYGTKKGVPLFGPRLHVSKFAFLIAMKEFINKKSLWI